MSDFPSTIYGLITGGYLSSLETYLITDATFVLGVIVSGCTLFGDLDGE